MAAEHGPTAGEYIIHHLTHLQNAKPKAVVDFSVFSFDSLFFSILLGIVGCFLLWMAARKASSGVPGRFQAAVELLVEMVDSQAKGIVHNAESRKFDRAAGPDHLRLDFPAQRDGPAAGGSAALHLGEDLCSCRP
jgi:F-type H+-transporting ATPase subunit a